MSLDRSVYLSRLLLHSKRARRDMLLPGRLYPITAVNICHTTVIRSSTSSNTYLDRCSFFLNLLLPVFVDDVPVTVRIDSHVLIVELMCAPGTTNVTEPRATDTGPPSQTPDYVNRGGGVLTGDRIGTVVDARRVGLASIIEVLEVRCASVLPAALTEDSEPGSR